MTRVPETGNYRVYGAGAARFIAVCSRLNYHGLLWTAVMDKIGDFIVGTADDTPLQLVEEVCAGFVGLRIEPCSELKMLIGEIEAYERGDVRTQYRRPRGRR